MLDDNLALDNAKLSYISSLSGGNQLLLNAFEETRPLSVPKLSTRFGLKEMLSAKKIGPIARLSALLFWGVDPRWERQGRKMAFKDTQYGGARALCGAYC